MPRIIIKGKGPVKAQFGIGQTIGQKVLPFIKASQSAQDQGIVQGRDFFTGSDAQGNPLSFGYNPKNPLGVKQFNEKYYTTTTTTKANWADKTLNYMNRLDFALDPIRTGLASLDAYKKYKRSARADKYAMLPDNYLAVGQQSAPDVMGDYDINTGMLGKPTDYVANKGQIINPTGYLPERGFYNMNAKYGGEQSMKIRITGLPNEEQMAYGGQARHSLDIRRDALSKPNITYDDPYEVNNTLQPVPRDEANLEAEKDETVFGDIDGDGGFEHFKVGGKRHTQGGTPLNLPEGSFVFSDTAKMRIKDEEVLAYFGLKPKKGGYTPAEIAKRYDVNRYKSVLENPEADELSKNTAQQMINNYNKKLAYLALIQESMKGFPQGIPDVAQKILGLQAPEEQMASPEDQEAMSAEMMQQPEEGMQEEMPQEEMPQQPMAKYGKTLKDLPKFQGTQQSQVASDPNYQFKARTPGRLDYSSPSYAGGIWSGNRYQNEWVPMVQQSLSDPSTAAQVMKNLENYTGPDASDVQAIIRTAKASNNPYVTIQKLATDKKVGPFHRALLASLQIPPTTPTTIQAPQPEKIIGWKCDPQTNEVVPSEYANDAEMKAAGAVSDRSSLPCSQLSDLKPGKTSQVPYGPLWPDVMNYTSATNFPPRNYRLGIKTAPYTSQRGFLDDPRSRLAENQSLQNAAAAALGATGDVRTLSSIMPSLQSQSLANASKIIDDVQGRNINILNQLAASDAQRQQAYNQYAADLATQKGFLTKDTDVGNLNQQRLYERSKGLARNTLWNNMMEMGLLNAVNQRYNIDPITGRVIFKSGAGPGSSVASNTPNRKEYLKLKSEFPNLTEEQYFKYRKNLIQGSDTDTDPYAPYYNFYNPIVPS